MSAADNEQRPCQIVGISGSIRPGSYTTMAVALALKGAKELKCETKLINLRDYELLFCDGKEDESKFPKAFSVCAETSGRLRESFWARPSITGDTAES
jgi:NAD(P)H-dependent FMN reductase